MKVSTNFVQYLLNLRTTVEQQAFPTHSVHFKFVKTVPKAQA